MVKKTQILLAIALCLVVLFPNKNAKGQDPIFSQFYANPLFLNPAMVGVERCPRFIMNYRNQWPSLSSSFVTYSASYDQHVDLLSGGLGGYVMADVAGEGVMNTVSAHLQYSYDLPVNRYFSFRAGFEASYRQRSLNPESLTFGDMIDRRYGFIYPTQENVPSITENIADFSVGLIGYSKQFFGGFAVNHITEPTEELLDGSRGQLPRKLTVHAGYQFLWNKRYPKEGYISPNFLLQRQGAAFSGQPNASQLYWGLYAKKEALVGGLWLRTNDGTNGVRAESFAVLLGMQSDYFRFGYSYDITISKLNLRAGGAHEISMAFTLDCKPKRRKFRPLNCPKF